MNENIVDLDIRWAERITIETRRQRRTGATMLRTRRNYPMGPIYSHWTDDPIGFAKFIFDLSKYGFIIDWRDDSAKKPAADVVHLRRPT